MPASYGLKVYNKTMKSGDNMKTQKKVINDEFMAQQPEKKQYVCVKVMQDLTNHPVFSDL